MAGKLESNLKALVWESLRDLPNLKKLNGAGAWHNPPVKSKKRKLPKLTVPHLARFLSRGPPPGLVIILVVLIVLATFLVALPGQPSPFGTLNDIHLSGTVYGVSNGDTLRAPFPTLKVVGEQSLDTLTTILGDLYGDWSHSFVGIDDTNPAIPDAFKLYQNYPNPFNPSTTIRYELPMNSMVSLILYNIIGQEVRKLFSGNQQAGHHSIVWDGKNNVGNGVSSGTYIYRLKAGNYAKSKKLTYLGGTGVYSRGGISRVLGKTTSQQPFEGTNAVEQALIDSTFTFVVSADTIETLVEQGIQLYDGMILDFYAQLKNRAPNVSNALITPTNPLDTDTLRLWYDSFDPDGDLDQAIKEWYKNGVLADTGSILLPSSFAAGDSIMALVRAFDGQAYGNVDTSNIVVVGHLNQAPALSQLPDQQTNEDVPLSNPILDLWTYASDPESPDSLLFFSILSQTNPQLANFMINNNRFLDLDSLRADSSGYSDVAVRVADPQGEYDDKTFRFNVNPMTDIRGLLFGVNPDSGAANYTLDSALVDIAGILDTTRNGGAYHVQITPTDEVYLQITHPGHHPRSIYIPALQDTNLVNHMAENSDDFPELFFNFLNDVFLDNHPNIIPDDVLLKWDTDSLSLWLKNPPDSAYAAFVDSAFAYDVPKFSGGTLKGYNTAVDSASARVSVRWRPWQQGIPYGSAYVWTDPDDPTKIIKADILLGDWLTWPDVRRSVTLEEALHIVYYSSDTQNSDYDQSIFWRLSSGTEMWDGDRKTGIVASKLPRGYEKNQ